MYRRIDVGSEIFPNKGKAYSIDIQDSDHEHWRNNQVWIANSRNPVKSYIVRDMTTNHILNVIRNVHHLDDKTLAHFYCEIDYRIRNE